MNKLLFIVNIILSVLIFGAVLAPYIEPSSSYFFSILGLFFPILIISNLLFFLYWILFKRKYALFPLLIFLLVYPSVLKTVQFNTPTSNSDESFSLLTYNIRELSLNLRDKGLNKDVEKFLLKDSDADIICIQEKRQDSKSNIHQLLKQYNFQTGKVWGNGIYTRFPIINSGTITIGGNTEEAVYADILVEKDTLRVYNFHLSSNRISGPTQKMIEKGDLTSKETYRSVKSLLKKYIFHANERKTQIEKLKQHMSNCNFPCVLAGDLNDVPLSFAYNSLSKNFQDTFKEKGNGFGISFRDKIPLLRIDYIFASQNIKVLNHQVMDQKFSDHYAVLSEFRVDN